MKYAKLFISSGGLRPMEWPLLTISIRRQWRLVTIIRTGIHIMPGAVPLATRYLQAPLLLLLHIHIHIKFQTRANMIISNRQSKHTYALVYSVGLHRAIYITACV